MNINFEDIITKANARKEALKEFEQAVMRLDDVLNDEANTYGQALLRYKRAYAALDTEAHSLLPERAAHDLAGWVSSMLQGHSYFRIKSSQSTPEQALRSLISS